MANEHEGNKLHQLIEAEDIAGLEAFYQHFAPPDPYQMKGWTFTDRLAGKVVKRTPAGEWSIHALQDAMMEEKHEQVEPFTKWLLAHPGAQEADYWEVRCTRLEQQLTLITEERDTLVADLRQRQAGQKSAEQQLQQVSTHRDMLLAALHEATDERVAVQEENAAMRALLERYVGMLRESFRADGSLAGEGFNVSLIDQLQFCREVRAFLAEHPSR